jgi:hypothetical protein
MRQLIYTYLIMELTLGLASALILVVSTMH